ncbi:MAG TPA: GNAT family N-acetyltransferase [Candidatus Nitrosotenuis sp.]|nr:GNAT family N-acetyltransferase [Candidatus Nitrosotenuis sp.]
MSHIKIRTATKNDILTILELLYEMERPKPKTKSEKTKFTKLVLQYLSGKDKKILVASDDSRVVGLLSLMFLLRLNRTRKELYIPELVVAKKYRRLGVGKMLIESCIGIAKKKNCYRIRLESGKQRKEAHKFYPSLGFEQAALSYNFNLE